MATPEPQSATVDVKQLTLPLRLSLAYVAATTVLYFFGVYAGEDPNSASVGLFMLAVLAMFTVGYLAGVRGAAGRRRVSLDEVRQRTSGRVANRVVVIGSLWFLCYSVASLQRGGMTDPLAVMHAIADPRASYYAKFAHLNSENGSAVYRALNLMGVLYFLTVPYLLLHWRDLRAWVRGLSIVSLGAYLLYFLSIGTQKGLADLLIMGFASALPLYVLRRGRSSAVAGRWSSGRRFWLIAGGAGLLGLVLIATSLGLRTDDTSSLLRPAHARALYERLSPVLGTVLGRGLVILSSYVSQGYHGLALALRLPFVAAGPLGAFRALSSYLPQYLGIQDPYLLTYPVRVEHAFGWSAMGRWSSVYPWYASVVSFPGMIFLAAAFGFFFARVWRRLLLACDGVAMSVFVTCVVVVLYSPANNQLFNERLSAIGVLTLLCLYAFRARLGALRSWSARSKPGRDAVGGGDAVAVGVLAPAFPPAFRGGGPIRSLEAMVSRTPHGFAAYVLTSDRDIGSPRPMPVVANRWIPGGDGAVYYASTDSVPLLFKGMRAVRARRPALIYLNSFFNRPMTMVPLLLGRMGFWGRGALVLLAPRGEFGSGALTRRNGRKRLWIGVVRLLRIDRGIVWHATSEQEVEDIRTMWGSGARVILRENDTLLASSALDPTSEGEGPLRLVFLGRLTDLKGAAIVLEALQGSAARVSLDVYGPHEDQSYFELCQALAASVPDNVSVEIHDGVEHDQVQDILNQYDVFVYPTAGENFGHVIAEALSSSCVVVTTPTTPWTSLIEAGGGVVVPDRAPQSWRLAIEALARLSPSEMLDLRRRAGRSYSGWATQPAGRHLWQLALEGRLASRESPDPDAERAPKM